MAERVILQKGVAVKRYVLSVIFRRVYSKHKDQSSRRKRRQRRFMNKYIRFRELPFPSSGREFYSRSSFEFDAIFPLQSLFLLLQFCLLHESISKPLSYHVVSTLLEKFPAKSNYSDSVKKKIPSFHHCSFVLVINNLRHFLRNNVK